LLPVVLELSPKCQNVYQRECHAPLMIEAAVADMFVEGSLTFEQARDAVNACMADFSALAESLPEATGTLVFTLSIAPLGFVTNTSILTNTLVMRPWALGLDNEDELKARLQHEALKVFTSHKYPEADGISKLTMPLIFE
jgi:hypothetical protein